MILKECKHGYNIHQIGNQGCGGCDLFIMDGICKFFNATRIKEETPPKLTYCKDCIYCKLLTVIEKQELDLISVGWELTCTKIGIFRKLYDSSCNKGVLKSG